MNTSCMTASAVGELWRFFVIFLTEKFSDSIALYVFVLVVCKPRLEMLKPSHHRMLLNIASMA
ncbi:MAG: hypothetical protein LWX23_01215 [Spirochaetia bacterium]|nr:hypothetical protein [Spirochaetia bacterium]MCE1208074.1 hypothetical protein [Spirochaetia bacterium]